VRGGKHMACHPPFPPKRNHVASLHSIIPSTIRSLLLRNLSLIITPGRCCTRAAKSELDTIMGTTTFPSRVEVDQLLRDELGIISQTPRDVERGRRALWGRSFDCIFFKESWVVGWEFVGVDGEVGEVEELEEAVHRLHVGRGREPPCGMYDPSSVMCSLTSKLCCGLPGCLLIMG
jgi:hypothetical protein